MESQNSSQKNSSQWTDEEDKLLVDTLGEFNVAGMKVDTGFKNGYLDKLEKIMHERSPNCGKKAKPQIQNRVKYLEKQAMTLNEMVAGNGSGFGWDDVNQKLVCDKVVYNDWCMSHPTAVGLFDKKFPHFNALVEIYATDRATGNDAMAPGDAEEQAEGGVECSEHYVTRDDIEYTDSSAIGDETEAPSTTCGGSKAKHKRNTRAGSNFYSSTYGLAENLSKICEATVPYLSTLTTALSKKADGNTHLAQEVLKIDGLSHVERLMAVDALSANPHRVALFTNTDDEEKGDFLAALCHFDR